MVATCLLIPWLAILSARAVVDIRTAEGGVWVFLPSLGDWRPVATTPYGLRPGDKVRLKPLSKAKLVFEEGSVIRASQDAVFLLQDDDEKGAVIELEKGRLDASVLRFHDRLFEVRAPGASVTLRDDVVAIMVTSRKVVVIEVTSGLADVQPAVGPAVQVPEGHRLEVPQAKAPGLPVPLREFRELQRRRAVEPGLGRKQHPPRDPSRPAIGMPSPDGGRPAPAPALGAGSLGLPPEPKPPPAPTLGVESLGVDPGLGPDALGLKETAAEPTRPSLGHKALGLKDPPPERSGPPGPKARRTPSTDLSPRIELPR